MEDVDFESVDSTVPTSEGKRYASQMLVSAQGRLPSRMIDFEVFKEKLAMLALHHEYSLSFVEHSRFREFIEYIWPEARHICRNTLEATIKKMNTREKDSLVPILHKLPGRICLTSGMWASSAQEDYICLTAHFIDDNWSLHSVVLNMHHFPPHSPIDMHDCLLNLIKEWGIEKKIFSITLDNARSNDNIQDLLRNSLSVEHPLPCSGQFFHVRCGAHILNLIIQDGLKVIDEAVGKVRDVFYWIEETEIRKMAFADCAKRKGCDFRKGLCRDTPTRWNSTFDMLARALLFRPAFALLAEEDLNFLYNLTEVEWYRVERICELLRPFNEITTIFSGIQYPTANLYFKIIWEIELCLKEHEESTDECIKVMAKEMKKKFKKYWECYSMVLAIAVVLDPQYKLEYVRFCYEELDSTTCDENVAKVKKVMEELYEEYSVEVNGGVRGGASQVPNIVTRLSGRDARFILRKFDANLNSRSSKLDVYLGESTVGFDEEINVLDWWKRNEKRYPALARMARDILAIPITTVASESTFSLGGRLLTKYKQNTSPPDIVESMIQTRSWMNTGENFQELPEPDDDAVPPRIVEINEDEGEDEGGRHQGNLGKRSRTHEASSSFPFLNA